MTQEQLKISEHNKYLAWKHFGINSGDGLVLHHINPEWKCNDIERYIQWNIEDLQVMTKQEHASLHHKGKHRSEETRKKMSESSKGRPKSEEHIKHMSEALKGKKAWNKGLTGVYTAWNKGVPCSEDTKEKIRQSAKGKHRVYREDGTYYLSKEVTNEYIK